MGKINKPMVNLSVEAMRKKMNEIGMPMTVPPEKMAQALKHINPQVEFPIEALPEEKRLDLKILKPTIRRFHGTHFKMSWLPSRLIESKCANKFGYMTNTLVRASKLSFNNTNQQLLTELGNLMGDTGRETAGDSIIPAGYTYFGQFVDHDITLDVTSTLDAPTDANKLPNMRTPALDLDSVYGAGPALDPYLYAFPSSGPSTAIKLQLGMNTPAGPGGPGGLLQAAGMIQQTTFDVPRVCNSLTAIIGDPRNDENLVVSQFHHAMLKFHNQVVDLLVTAGFAGDIFEEARKVVTHHYQWAVVHDFLKRICGAAAVNNALVAIAAPVGSAFRMPVEFSVAAYRFGHSMIRDNYWVNFNFIKQPLSDLFDFIRVPNLPVLSNWVVDFNAFFDTGIFVPVNNKARKIDSVLAHGLESLPGGLGIMAILATRNLLRGLALGLPSGQAVANAFGIPPLTTAQLTSGLPAAEIQILNKNRKLLLRKTPLWYYVLREAAVLKNGDQLGPVGAKIVADTFVRMLKRDGQSFINAPGFIPFLPADTPGQFTVTDIIKFSGVNQP